MVGLIHRKENNAVHDHSLFILIPTSGSHYSCVFIFSNLNTKIVGRVPYTASSRYARINSHLEMTGIAERTFYVESLSHLTPSPLRVS